MGEGRWRKWASHLMEREKAGGSHKHRLQMKVARLLKGQICRVLRQHGQEGPLCPRLQVWGAHEWAQVLSPWPSHLSSPLSLPQAWASPVLSGSSNFAERQLLSI